MFAIPLAWLQLTREKIRLLVALAGIGFAVILMFMQLGFRDALFESAVTFHKELQGDIFLVSPQSNALIAMRGFSQRRLYQVLGYAGVEAVSPIYLNFALWKNPETRATRGIMVIGINPSDRVFSNHIFQLQDVPDASQSYAQSMDQIKLEDVVLFDEASRPEFGDIPAQFQRYWQARMSNPAALATPVLTEVRGRQVKVGGIFRMGASFGADGNLITSDLNFLRIFDRSDKGIIEIGLIKLKPDVDPQEIQANLRQGLPEDVLVLTRSEFIDFERRYWQDSTAIGFIFTLGTAMGFIVGTVIVYQILYTDVTDHLAEYATLKAMGYRNLYLTSLVLQEALILSVLGYIPGFALCLGLYDLTLDATALPIQMTLERGVLVFTLTILMCAVSAAIAIRKAQSADPADIF